MHGEKHGQDNGFTQESGGELCILELKIRYLLNCKGPFRGGSKIEFQM